VNELKLKKMTKEVYQKLANIAQQAFAYLPIDDGSYSAADVCKWQEEREKKYHFHDFGKDFDNAFIELASGSFKCAFYRSHVFFILRNFERINKITKRVRFVKGEISNQENQVKQSKTPSKEKVRIIMGETKKAAYNLDCIKKGEYEVSQKSETKEMGLLIRGIAHYILQQTADKFNDPDFTLQADFIKAFVNRVKADNVELPLSEDQLAMYMAQAFLDDLGITELPEYTLEELDAPIQAAKVEEPAKQDTIIPEQTKRKGRKSKAKVKEEVKEEPKQEVEEESQSENDSEEGIIRQMYDNITVAYPDAVILFRDVIEGYYSAILNDAPLIGQYMNMEISTESGFPMICVEKESLEVVVRKILDNNRKIVFLDWNDFMPAHKEEPKSEAKVEEPVVEEVVEEVEETAPQFDVERSSIKFGNRLFKTLVMRSGDCSLTIAPNSLWYALTKNNEFISDAAEELFNRVDALIPDNLITSADLDMDKICKFVEEFLSASCAM
jgi:hypothetical protein